MQNTHNALSTCSCRQFAKDIGMPLPAVSAIAVKLNLPKNGTAPNSSFVLNPQAKIAILEESIEISNREIAQSKREILASNNELIKQGEFLCALTGLTGSPLMMKAAEEALAEQRANKLTCLDCDREPVHTAANRIQAMIANYKGIRV